MVAPVGPMAAEAPMGMVAHRMDTVVEVALMVEEAMAARVVDMVVALEEAIQMGE